MGGHDSKAYYINDCTTANLYKPKILEGKKIGNNYGFTSMHIK